jgi:hypothetical protein
VRVNKKFILEFHIDIDEANGAGIKHGDPAYLMVPHKSTSMFELNGNTLKEYNLKKDEIKKKAIIEPMGLITEETVRQAWKKEVSLAINKDVICTPLARDAIRELGVEVIWR